MRTVLCLVCMFLLTGLSYPWMSSVRAEAAAVHHLLDVTLHPERKELVATDRMTIDAGGEQLCFRLARGASVSRVTVNGAPAGFSFLDGRFCLRKPATGNKGEARHTVELSYAAVFDDPVPRNPVHTEDPSYGVTGVIGPAGTLLLGGVGWYPRMRGTTATFTLRVNGPAGYEAVTTGECMARKTEDGVSTSLWEVAVPDPNLALSAGPYVITEEAVGGVALYTYFWAEDQGLAPAYLEATARYIRLYSDLFGPYPFRKFAVVANFFPTGYGFPSYTLLGRRVIRLPFIIETSLGHEIAHSWWGNGVRVDYERGNWSEGVTSYVADHLYKERSSPEEGRTYRLNILRDYAALVPPEKDFALREFLSRVSPATRVVGYGKGAMVFHMLRRLLGDEVFWRALGTVFQEKRFQRASWEDFAVIMGRVGGRQLGPFFAQWVDRVGAPVLELADVTAHETGGSWTVRGKMRQSEPCYALQVPVRLEMEDGESIHTVSSSTVETPFVFRLPRRPTRLLLDPEVDLFRRLFPGEIPATVNGIKASEKLAVVYAEGVSAELAAAGKVLLRGLGHPGISVMEEKQTSPSALTGHDLLLVGLPTGKDWIPVLSGRVLISSDPLVVADRALNQATDSAFLTCFTPERNGRIVALFVAPSLPAATAVARKIPHYGKYSYLVFSGEKNVAKGAWPVDASPLVHRFSR